MRWPATARRAWKLAAPISTPSPSICSGSWARCGRCCPTPSKRTRPSHKEKGRRFRRPFFSSLARSVFRYDWAPPIEPVVHARNRLLAVQPQRNSIGQRAGVAERRDKTGRKQIAGFGAEIEVVVLGEHRPVRRKLPLDTAADRVAHPGEVGLLCQGRQRRCG